MYLIPLTSVPNQSISFNVDGAFWEVHVHQSVLFMVVDILRNGESIVTGSRAQGGVPMMPYEYMYEPAFGNFIFDADCDWELFGTSVNLYYLTNDEFHAYLAALDAGAFTEAFASVASGG